MRKRLRSTIKWGGTALTVLLLVVWVGSARWAAGIDHTPQFGASAIGGRLSIGWFENMSFPPRSTEWKGPVSHQAPFGWWFRWQRRTNPGGGIHTQVSIPLWAVVLLFASPTAWIWWRESRPVRIGLCVKCGYDLRGNASGVCPECGAAAPRGEAPRELKVES